MRGNGLARDLLPVPCRAHDQLVGPMAVLGTGRELVGAPVEASHVESGHLCQAFHAHDRGLFLCGVGGPGLANDRLQAMVSRHVALAGLQETRFLGGARLEALLPPLLSSLPVRYRVAILRGTAPRCTHRVLYTPFRCPVVITSGSLLGIHKGGSLVMVSFDWADPPLLVAKSLRHLSIRKNDIFDVWCTRLFAIFIVIFVFTRNGVYNYLVYRALRPGDFAVAVEYQIIQGFLLALASLQTYWLVLIVKTLVRMATTGNVEDVREDGKPVQNGVRVETTKRD